MAVGNASWEFVTSVKKVDFLLQNFRSMSVVVVKESIWLEKLIEMVDFVLTMFWLLLKLVAFTSKHHNGMCASMLNAVLCTEVPDLIKKSRNCQTYTMNDTV